MLHGEIKVNHHIIGEWRAVNKGRVEDITIYQCNIKYEKMTGHKVDRDFFVMHRYGDGALALTSAVCREASIVVEKKYHSSNIGVLWRDFCENYGLSVYCLID